MTCFLTSSPCLYDGRLNPANRFIEEIKKALPNRVRCLYLSSSEGEHELNDRYGKEIKKAFELSAVFFESYTIIDGRNKEQLKEKIAETNLIILAGGHVPTEMKFYSSLGLKKKLKNYSGVIIGISAGSMVAAKTIYSQPELEGESIDPNYRRFFPGLDLCDMNILPHYNELAGSKLDGKSLYEEITFEDSVGKSFYVFVDGTYVYWTEHQKEIRGEAYLIKDKTMTQISKLNQIIKIK